MKIRYIDINTGEKKTAKYFNTDNILDLTWLIDENGTRFCVARWQIVK